MNRHIIISLLLILIITSCHPNQKKAKGMIALTPSLADAVNAFKDTGILEAHPLIAVSKYADSERYKDIRKLETPGALETIVSMHPEVVLLHSSDSILAEKLRQFGIKVIMHDMDTLDDIRETLTDIGAFFNQAHAADQIISQMHTALNDNRHRFRDNRSDIPQALIIVDRLDAQFQQLYIAQKPAYLYEIFEGCGVDPIQIRNQSWAQINAETLIHLNPPMIVFLARDLRDMQEIQSKFEHLYADLDAVKNHMLYIYPDSDITVPGPDIADKQIMCQFTIFFNPPKTRDR